MDSLSYLYYMVLFCWVPIAFLWLRYGKILKKRSGIIAKVVGIASIAGFLWNELALFYGTWYYGSGKILGIYVSLMPVEDVLFIASVSLVITSATVVLLKAKKI